MFSVKSFTHSTVGLCDTKYRKSLLQKGQGCWIRFHPGSDLLPPPPPVFSNEAKQGSDSFPVQTHKDNKRRTGNQNNQNNLIMVMRMIMMRTVWTPMFCKSMRLGVDSAYVWKMLSRLNPQKATGFRWFRLCFNPSSHSQRDALQS